MERGERTCQKDGTVNTRALRKEARVADTERAREGEKGKAYVSWR